MSQSVVVDALPVLSQADFPPLPEVPQDRVLLIFQSDWRNMEKEHAAGVIITACVRAGKWQPVSAVDFGNILMDRHFTFSRNDVINAVWSLADAGFLKVVRFDSKDYIVPDPKLAKVALSDKSKLRYTNRY